MCIDSCIVRGEFVYCYGFTMGDGSKTNNIGLV